MRDNLFRIIIGVFLGLILLNIVLAVNTQKNSSNSKVDEKVRIKLDYAATQNVKWEWGGGYSQNGLTKESFVLIKEGRLTINNFNETAQQPIIQTVNVVDNRKIIMFPPNPKVGQIVKFSGLNFATKNLNWKINFEPEKFGLFINYKCLSSGPHKVVVSETIGTTVLKKELIFNVTETRKVTWTPLNPRAGEEVKFITVNFQFGRLLWDYGDGDRNLNKTVTTHIFNRMGNYIVKVVDNPGKDTKEFKYRISIDQDPRVVIGPVKTISVGETIFLNARGFYDKNLEWDVGDGKKITGQQTLSHQFLQPGTYQVKVRDRSGKDKKAVMYQVQVKKDPRKLTASRSSAKVEESITFKAVNFYDNKVKWDFGDRKVLVGGKEISHQYGKNGEYIVKAIDYSGQDVKTFSVKVNIQIARSHVSELMISGGEIYFEATGRNYIIISEDFTKLNARVILKFEGSGNFRGYWYLNGKKYQMVNKNLSFGQAATLELKSIPTMQAGLHILSFKTEDPRSSLSLNAYYFVSVGKEKVYLLNPKDKQIIKGNKFQFKWKNPTKAVKSRLYFSTELKNLFKKPLLSLTVKKDQQKEITLPQNLKGRVYWYIKSLDAVDKLLGISDIGVFNIE